MKVRTIRPIEIDNVVFLKVLYCYGQSCDTCRLAKVNNGTNLDCDGFIGQYTDKALGIIGFEKVEDEPQTETEKPLTEWTLQEVKEHCEKFQIEDCKGCFLTDHICCLLDSCPYEWDLQRKPKPRWTEKDIKYVKAIKLLYPWAEFITKNNEEIVVADDFVVTTGVKHVDIQRNNNIFADLNFGTAYTIDKILADGQNSANGQNKED